MSMSFVIAEFLARLPEFPQNAIGNFDFNNLHVGAPSCAHRATLQRPRA
jgi:hypothetical protein